jgi:hypothetical protein
MGHLGHSARPYASDIDLIIVICTFYLHHIYCSLEKVLLTYACSKV